MRTKMPNVFRQGAKDGLVANVHGVIPHPLHETGDEHQVEIVLSVDRIRLHALGNTFHKVMVQGIETPITFLQRAPRVAFSPEKA